MSQQTLSATDQMTNYPSHQWKAQDKALPL
jgi:hypothetical protein